MLPALLQLLSTHALQCMTPCWLICGGCICGWPPLHVHSQGCLKQPRIIRGRRPRVHPRLAEQLRMAVQRRLSSFFCCALHLHRNSWIRADAGLPCSRWDDLAARLGGPDEAARKMGRLLQSLGSGFASQSAMDEVMPSWLPLNMSLLKFQLHPQGSQPACAGHSLVNWHRDKHKVSL